MSGAKQQAEWSAERAGRRVCVVALVFGVAYLVWRFGWSWNDRGPGSVVWWLAVPSLAIEFVGFAGTALLMWALWRAPGRAEEPANHHGLAPYDIVIDVRAAPVVDLRATLVALRLERTHAPIFVVDRSSRSVVEDLAVEFGVRYLAADADDITGLAAARDASTAEALLMLEAGDIPAAGAGGSLFAVLAGAADVAGVQGIVVSTTGDSAEHAPNGRHDL